jgi:hypothetical protein
MPIAVANLFRKFTHFAENFVNKVLPFVNPVIQTVAPIASAAFPEFAPAIGIGSRVADGLFGDGGVLNRQMSGGW